MRTDMFVRWLACILTAIPWIGCTLDAPVDQMPYAVMIDKNIVGDVFGNTDGKTSPEELRAVDAYFSANVEAWCITANFSSVSNRVEAAEIIACFSRMATHPYAGEQQLRNAMQGTGLRTPYVGVGVLIKQNGEIAVKSIYRAPGPTISTASWEQLTIE